MASLKIVYLLSFILCLSAFHYDEGLATELGGYGMAAYCADDNIVNWTAGTISSKYPDGLTDLNVIYDKSKVFGSFYF